MKALLLIISVLMQVGIPDRVIPCHTHVMLDPDYYEYMDLYENESDTSALIRIRNNKDKEMYVIFEITGKASHRFRVNYYYDSYPISGGEYYVDIEHLVVGSCVNGLMALYSSPSFYSSIVIQIPDSSVHLYMVLDCHDDWLYVLYEDENGVKTSGWMPRSSQCPLAYTSCG